MFRIYHPSSFFGMYTFILTRYYCSDTRSSFKNPLTLGERFYYFEEYGQDAEYQNEELGGDLF